MTQLKSCYIDTPGQLQALCEELRHSPVLALDTEFVREKTYYAQFCLLQIATEDVIACVDPLALRDLSPLLEVIYNPKITKVLHAARQDLELFYDLRGTLPGPVFDTQIAAALQGQGAQVAYGALVKALLGVSLDKAHARTDWARRPLSEEQLHYAADDVRYLLPIYRQQQAALQAAGRLDWLDSDFAALVDVERYRLQPDELWKRIRGLQVLKGVQLAVLQRLAAWREQQAVAANKPRKWIVGDDQLLDIARLRPRDMAHLTRIRGLNAAVVERHGEAILAQVRQALELPADQWPALPPRRVLDNIQEALVDMLMAAVRLNGEQHQVSPQVLTTRKELEQLVLGERQLAVLSGWRRALVGEALLAVLAGERCLQVQQGTPAAIECSV